MADAILSIERISALLIREAVFLNEVSDEVESLKAELKRMLCFLKDVDRKQEQDERLRNRVTEIRDLAYDAEDVIDSFILKVAHQGGFQGIIKRFTSIFTKPIHLHKIGVKVKEIQAKLEAISKSLPVFQISGEAERPSSSAQQLLRRTYSHVEEEDVVSLQSVTRQVLDQLLREDEGRPHVVSIVGMGGIGKTTLARKVYNHIEAKHHFDCFAWACISQQCKSREVVHDVLIKVLSPSREDRKLIDKQTDNELIKRLFDALKERRYLIVVDDLWKSEDWNILKLAFPRGEKGSKILITTRNKEVASLAGPYSSPIELPFLDDDESWKLFSMKAFPKNTKECDARSREFEMLGKEMVKKCGGLPLAIVVLGGLLATKVSRAQWEMVRSNIHAQSNKFQQQHHQYVTVMGILALSYNDLPYCLKPCFLYVGHYPEDWEISKKELIRLWIAEGFISPSLENEGTLMENVAEQFLEELINRCLVQVGKVDYTGTGVKTCRIHDLLRDFCMEKAKEENFLETMRSVEENNVNSIDVTLTASMPRRIVIHPSKRYVNLKGEHQNLRSLLLFQNEELIKFHISTCKDFKFLRVLKIVRRDLKKWYVSSKIGDLHHLRYLALKCEAGEVILPCSIGNLKNLHTLHIESHRFSITPDVVFKLERLRHILLFVSFQFSYDAKKLCSSPRFSLKNIETLKYVWVENLNEKNAVLGLKNIRSLGIKFKRSKAVEIFLEAVIQFHRLRSLEMEIPWLSTESYQDLEPLSQCQHLSKLSLGGRIEENHHDLKFVPTNIIKLNLSRSKLKLDPMAVLEKLPLLRILRLRAESYMGTKLICSANAFLRLDSLDFVLLLKLEEWEIEEGAMPRLQSLRLRDCRKLKMFPEGLRYLTALQEMKLEFMSGLAERIKVIDGREGDDFSKVSHIPSIPIFPHSK